ncbi:MAG: Trimethylamine methyltransferase MttB [Candidatus Heimdallarchaeota archaeon LC_3]|nr:MAG: Trimethylamine methyltransferase MttB [Candidatus Heimdallarchaeota archaeon LC_3]
MGILRPKIQILDEQHKKDIFEEAKQILLKIGIFIENEEAEELLKAQGVENKEKRYFIPPDLVDRCLKSIPNEISLYDREGTKTLTLKDDNIHYDPGSAAIFILDENTGKIREPVHKDFIRFTKIVDQCKNIDAQSTAVVYSDVPKEAQDWHRLYTALSYGHKPVVTGTFKKESFAIMKELLLACRKSEKDLANKPLAIFDACPSPPLNWSDLTTQSLIDAARSGIPSEFISMPMAGSTGPITLIGCITQHCAESLAGIVISQLATKGSPVIWGGSPSVMDMRYGTTPMGAVGTMTINVGDAEMGKFLELPTHAYMGLSDSKIPDAQAGLETNMGALLAGLTGINMISGVGMQDFESCQSIEKLLIDNEIVGMVKHFIKGIEDHGSPFASEILSSFYDKNELLSHPTTMNLFRKEQFIVSPIIARMTRNEWEEKGSTSARQRSKEMIPKLLNKEPISPIDESLSKELEKISKVHL